MACSQIAWNGVYGTAELVEGLQVLIINLREDGGRRCSS